MEKGSLKHSKKYLCTTLFNSMKFSSIKFSSISYIFIVFIFLASFLFMVKSSIALTPNLAEGDMPVKVNANDMVYDMDGNTITFIGDVVVTRGEFIMKSSKMKIFMQGEGEPPKKNIATAPKIIPLTGNAPKIQIQKSENGQSDIERIEAYNGVAFDYGPQSGTSESAVYDAQRALLTMRGNPVVREGENIIQGDTIRYYMNERRSEVIGSENKRVEAIFSNKQ